MPMHDWTRVSPNDYHHFHGAWIYAICGALNDGLLPPGYFALAEQSVRPIGPDVLTVELPDAADIPTGPGVYAVDTYPPQTTITARARTRRRTLVPRRLAIRYVDDRLLVAVVELMSPGNKSNDRDFRAFLDKAVGVVMSGVHLLVIDPFRPTSRDPGGIHAAVWRAATNKRYTPPPDKPLTVASYASADKLRAFVTPLAVGDRLPDAALFFTPDRYVNVPLEATYAEAWRGFPAALKPRLDG